LSGAETILADFELDLAECACAAGLRPEVAPPSPDLPWHMVNACAGNGWMRSIRLNYLKINCFFEAYLMRIPTLAGATTRRQFEDVVSI